MQKIPKLLAYREIYLMDLVGADATRYNYKRVFDLAISELGDIALHEISMGHIKSFKAYLAAKYNSKQTVNRYLGFFRTIYLTFWKTYSKEIYDLDPSYFFTKTNPFHRVMYSSRELKQDSTKGHYFLSDIEFNKVLSAAMRSEISDPEMLHDLLMVCRYLGLRRGEALSIKPEHIKDDHVLVYAHKTNELRKVPLFKEVAGILKRRKQSTVSEFIFYYGNTMLFRHYKQVLSEAELDSSITLHTLRKTFGSSHILSGVPIRKVSDWLGHSQVKQTEDWYYILLNNDHQKWIDKAAPQKEREISYEQS